MEFQQALADLAEVRGRLATEQRFDGYSGWAAISSGVVAVVAGLAQGLFDPHPRSAPQISFYLFVWLSCLGVALAINYGAILAWRARHRDSQSLAQMRTVGWTILPAVAAGGVMTAALIGRGLYTLLPGMWCATYALGLFASRSMVPRDVVYVAVAFGVCATALLLVPQIDVLAWWIMPLAFGCGQIVIGLLVRARPEDEQREGAA
ncbi:MAG TPA: hypothetical protein VME66_10460 [Candidatus Acidoferrales bacterium]|nr:hypothetical protein [Candidatus Acidoferrales bacterium]